MIYEQIMYGIKCDRCKEIYINHVGVSVNVDKHDELEGDAEYDGWYVDGDHHYCPKCHKINNDEELEIFHPINHLFFRFKMVLQSITSITYEFDENETHFILKNQFCYKQLTEVQIGVLKDIISDFTVEYSPNPNVNFNIETIYISKKSLNC